MFFFLNCLHLLIFAIEVSCGTYNTSSWHRFWWWTPGKKWPSGVTDVLKNAYGTCKFSDHYCFQRLPSWAREDATELLAIDNEGTVYRWQFDSKNPTAHAVWQALHDHKKTHNGNIKNKKAWNPQLWKERNLRQLKTLLCTGPRMVWSLCSWMTTTVTACLH